MNASIDCKEVGMIKALTIRNVPPSLAEALEREKRRKGKSLNQTVIDLLGQGLGAEGVRSNGLGRLAGGWSEDEFRAFERATAQFEVVDEELWR
jgi:plasmid stability protein